MFTLEEANELIPKIELVMEKIQRCGIALREEIEKAAGEMGCGVEEVEVPELLRRRPEVGRLASQMEAHVQEIEGCGGQFKGFDLGLVDFPAELEGEEVLLCWQFGEKEIAHYHARDAGFAGRQPLPATARRSYVQ